MQTASTHTRIDPYTNEHNHANTYSHAYGYTHTRTCINAQTHLQSLTHTHMHTCIHAYMHTCIHAYMHTCMHACIHTYIHTSTHIHTRQTHIDAETQISSDTRTTDMQTDRHGHTRRDAGTLKQTRVRACASHAFPSRGPRTENRILETMRWLKRQNGKQETEQNKCNANQAKRATGKGRNGRDSNPTVGCQKIMFYWFLADPGALTACIRTFPEENHGCVMV